MDNPPNCFENRIAIEMIIFSKNSLLIILVFIATMIPITLGSSAKNRALAGEKVLFGLPIEWYLGLYVTFDAVGFARMLADLGKISRNREAFVKDAMYKAMYASHGNYSVLVYSLRKDYKWIDEPSMDHTLYTSMTYNKNIYGIWVFQDTAIFQNLGDDDPKQWAYYGRYKKVGKQITFFNMN